MSDTSGIRQTCPKIDKVIEAVQRAEGFLGDDERDADFRIHSALNALSDIETLMEEIREANDDLRQHGSRLDDELTEARAEIDQLEKQLEEEE